MKTTAHKTGADVVWEAGKERVLTIVYATDDGRTRVYVPTELLPKGQRTLKTAPAEADITVSVAQGGHEREGS